MAQADAEMNFKETIRKEIVEKISTALDIVYSNAKSTKLYKDFDKVSEEDLDQNNVDDFQDEYFSDEEAPEGYSPDAKVVQSNMGKGTLKR